MYKIHGMLFGPLHEIDLFPSGLKFQTQGGWKNYQFKVHAIWLLLNPKVQFLILFISNF